MKKISLFIICLVLLVFGASTTSARQLLSRRRDGQREGISMFASFIERLGKKRKGKKMKKKKKKVKKTKTTKVNKKKRPSKKPSSSSGTIQLPTNFNCECYLTRYRDLRNAFKNDCQKAQQHYVMNGIKEGRDPTCSGPNAAKRNEQISRTEEKEKKEAKREQKEKKEAKREQKEKKEV